jgi:Spy/CpxP family protein refolding chaperone
MKAENKHTILVWTVVVLAIMNISTLATIGYRHYCFRKMCVTDSNTGKQLETDAMKYSGRYFRDRLGIKDEQIDQFRDINRSFRQNARGITIDLAEKRKEMMVEMSKDIPDTIKLNALSEDIGKLHAALKMHTYQYYLNLKKISTPEQKLKLENLFKEMLINDTPMGFPGKGPGWLQNNKKEK